MSRKALVRLSFALFVFSWFVIALGAWTRLTNSGLSCPDWPLCYGHLIVPSQMDGHGTFHALQGWYEMTHRCIAGILVLGILTLAIGVFRFDKEARVSRWATAVMLLILCYQPWLGAMTVLDKLYPAIVSQHLLCGFSLMSLLWYHYDALREDHIPSIDLTHETSCLFRSWLVVLIALVCQIALGVWTSTNNAAIACPNFPICSMSSWNMMWHDGLNLFRHLGDVHDPAQLEAIRRTIQVVHRFGALLVGSALFYVQCITIIRRPNKTLMRLASFSLGFLLLQITLGIMNAVYARPLGFALAHNLTAAALLWSVVAIVCVFSRCVNAGEKLQGM